MEMVWIWILLYILKEETIDLDENLIIQSPFWR